MAQPPASRPAQDESEGAEVKRARRLAMAARDAGLDDEVRGDVIAWYTFGDTRSGKDLNEEQAADLFIVFQKIRTMKCDIRYDEKGQLYLEGETGIKGTPGGRR